MLEWSEKIRADTCSGIKISITKNQRVVKYVWNIQYLTEVSKCNIVMTKTSLN